MPTFSAHGRVALIASLIVAALAAALLALSGPARTASAVGEPGAGSLVALRQGQLVAPTAATGAGTAFSSIPRTVNSIDYSAVGRYYAGDVFVLADFATTGTLTATVQFCPTAETATCVDAYQEIDSGSAVVSAPRRVVITGDGGGYLSLPIAGQYWRLKMERSASVTPRVEVVLKNTGGN